MGQKNTQIRKNLDIISKFLYSNDKAIGVLHFIIVTNPFRILKLTINCICSWVMSVNPELNFALNTHYFYSLDTRHNY